MIPEVEVYGAFCVEPSYFLQFVGWCCQSLSLHRAGAGRLQDSGCALVRLALLVGLASLVGLARYRSLVGKAAAPPSPRLRRSAVALAEAGRRPRPLRPFDRSTRSRSSRVKSRDDKLRVVPSIVEGRGGEAAESDERAKRAERARLQRAAKAASLRGPKGPSPRSRRSLRLRRVRSAGLTRGEAPSPRSARSARLQRAAKGSESTRRSPRVPRARRSRASPTRRKATPARINSFR